MRLTTLAPVRCVVSLLVQDSDESVPEVPESRQRVGSGKDIEFTGLLGATEELSSRLQTVVSLQQLLEIGK